MPEQSSKLEVREALAKTMVLRIKERSRLLNPGDRVDMDCRRYMRVREREEVRETSVLLT